MAEEVHMNEETKKALELARASLENFWLNGQSTQSERAEASQAIAAIDAALAPAAQVARCAQCKKEYRHGSGVGCPKCAPGVSVPESEFRKPTAAPAAPVAQQLPACHVAVIGFRWDGERQHHVPQLLIEFEPVPANTGNTAKGWVDRDSLAKILSGIGQRGRDVFMPLLHQDHGPATLWAEGRDGVLCLRNGIA